MTRRMHTREFNPDETGINGALANATTDGSVISTAGYQTLTVFYEFFGAAGAATSVDWTYRVGRLGSATEYKPTSVAVSAGTGTWSPRSETYSLASTGTSENFTVRYDVTDYDFFKLENVGTTSGTAAETITAYISVSNPGT